MIYHFLYPWHDTFHFLNVFKYITFRTTYAVITSLVLSFLLGPPFIQYLARKNFGERIRSDVPENHRAKGGTPTMGGLLILASFVLPALLWADVASHSVMAAILTAVLFGLIGVYDDATKLHDGRGISGRRKLLLQALACVPILFLVSQDEALRGTLTHVYIPFFKHLKPDLGYLYYIFAALVIIGASNAVNLTDGLDGLAIGPIIISFTAYTFISYVAGHALFSGYLQIPFIKGVGEVTVLCGAVVGASLGFLWFNAYPAQVFMGNTGSVPLGALLGVTSILTKHELLLMLVGGIFVVEALSVIMQVGYFKMTHKRVFLMAPIHHHFEKLGWPETKVTTRFWIISILLALLSLSTLKLR
ncbi:MAG: phospho-N-acetylmuramoyl-pentapeptide-transferase [Nitrospinae bacterium]|nr:phospho-N-acetylmuramoyl-pentapeptide-transferase [Nitrospinota bacterium]